jgi:hypothetical protein
MYTPLLFGFGVRAIPDCEPTILLMHSLHIHTRLRPRIELLDARLLHLLDEGRERLPFSLLIGRR